MKKKKNLFYIFLFLMGSFIFFNNVSYSFDSKYIECGSKVIPGGVVEITRAAKNLLQIILPLVLIIYGSFDFVKAVMAFNANDMKVKQKQFLRRLVAAVLAFFVVTLVEFVIKFVADTSDYSSCIACAVSSEEYCGAEVERPFSIENPEQQETYVPDPGFVQPPLDLGKYDEETGGSNPGNGDNPGNDTPGDSNEIVAYAKKWVGTAYVWGGESLVVGNPSKGVDCSGFTKKVFEHFGVSLPHSAHSQSSLGTAVSDLSSAKPGDLLFWDWGGDGRIDHVAIYIGNNQRIHASGNQRCKPFSNNGCQVKIDSSSMNKITKIRRVS